MRGPGGVAVLAGPVGAAAEHDPHAVRVVVIDDVDGRAVQAGKRGVVLGQVAQAEGQCLAVVVHRVVGGADVDPVGGFAHVEPQLPRVRRPGRVIGPAGPVGGRNREWDDHVPVLGRLRQGDGYLDGVALGDHVGRCVQRHLDLVGR